MEYASFLRHHIEQIIELNDSEFDIVQTYFHPKKVKKKEYLINKGNKVTSEFLVINGCLKAFTFDESGKEYIVQFAMENWWISDYPAFSKQTEGEMCVQALENCTVLELAHEHKLEMIGRVRSMTEFFGKKSFSGYVALQNRVLSLLKNSPKEKYELLLNQYPELFQRVSKTMIAHYLGVSRETLSRLQNK
ncbi:Crp/Fnr family transcriptional regulator [Moheibacter sediminis]|uniref:cAMP-binding domain of CRP or a regulatory subunit of cAMP-dependent protein kinases n=1 Tax=Moheibacter sediminis TaxID=1434700 RepID=A0A1W2ATX9_9FLAO|nr:Crp/Fnr family transcriptional regulator [Moheibacter sediminis]SMC63648.1 cAMP-binding domain of CRP or a regulatory subunit of cAMP-dependent protein kinases [Moheibacter sediminis]